MHPAADVKLRNPMTGSLPGCCARAASGRAAERDERAPSHAETLPLVCGARA